MKMLELQKMTGYPMRVKNSKEYLEFLTSIWDRTALRRGDRAVLNNYNKGDDNE